MMFSDQPPQLDPPTPLADGTFGLDEDSFHEWLPSSGVLIGDGTDANDQGVTVFAWPTSQVKGGPGEGLARFLIKFRHPTMPKYISRWKWQGNHCLATVPITPLSELDCDAIPLLLKLAGAHSLLEALDFLHSRANVSPGPLSSVNVFIGRDGAWKLCSTREREADETNRRNDLRTLAQVLEDAAILGDSVADVEAVLPGVSDFLDALKSLSVPSARQLLSHPVFNHPFVETLNFLHQLPLKTEEETDNFFRSLIVRLSDVPESVIAVLLSESLLSRLVLLNDTARREFLPSFLSPKANQLPANSEGVTSDENVRPVLSTPLFLSHVLPRVQRILGIRDKPIRLAILENLHRFMSVVPRDLLRNDFLPHVLLGLQDSDDSLVSATLRTLSQLVPILGAAAVVGPRSRPIFFDGRPKDKNRILLESSTPNGVPALPAVPTPTGTLLERSAPDGGEVPSEVPTIESTEVMETSAKNAKESAVEGLDDARVGSEASTQKDVVDLWEDDQSDYEEALAAPPASTAPQGTAVEEAVSESSSGKTLLSQSLSNPSDIGTDTRARLSTGSSSSKPMRLSSSSSASYKRPAISDNLDAADIKTLQWKVKSDPGGSGALADPVDELFAGMAPEIAKVSTVRVDDSSSKTSSSASKFSMVDVLNDDQGDTGWDELEW